MGGTVTLENDKIGGMPRELDRQGTCGASVSVFMGGERNISRQAGFMRKFIYHMWGGVTRARTLAQQTGH